MDLLLVTRTDCGFCEQAKGVIKRVSQSFEFSVATLDLDSAEGAELARSAGMLFPPGLFIDRELVFYGRLSERRLRKELEHRSLSVAPPDQTG